MRTSFLPSPLPYPPWDTSFHHIRDYISFLCQKINQTINQSINQSINHSFFRLKITHTAALPPRQCRCDAEAMCGNAVVCKCRRQSCYCKLNQICDYQISNQISSCTNSPTICRGVFVQCFKEVRFVFSQSAVIFHEGSFTNRLKLCVTRELLQAT